MNESPLTPRFQLRLDWYRAHGFSYTISRTEGECSIVLENTVLNRWEKFTFKTPQLMEDWNIGLEEGKPTKHEWKQTTTVIQFDVPGQVQPRPEEPIDITPKRKIEP